MSPDADRHNRTPRIRARTARTAPTASPPHPCSTSTP